MSKQVINGKTYWQDAKGGLVPDEMIKQIDKERDALVQEWITKAKQLHEQMVDFKGSIFGDIQAFVELSAEKYDAKLGGEKGNVTLFSFDGKYKIQRAISETLQFDERIFVR